MDAGADYVGTIRKLRQDSWWRKVASKFLNRVRERTTRIRMTDQGCMLRGYDRRIIDAVNRCREVTPFIPALAYTFARHPVEIQVEHEERAVGESKYSMLHLLRLNFDLMTGYSRLPLQVFSWSGIIIACLSLLFVVLPRHPPSHDRAGSRRHLHLVWHRLLSARHRVAGPGNHG